MQHWHHCAYNVYQHFVYLGRIDNVLLLQQRLLTHSQNVLLLNSNSLEKQVPIAVP